MEDKLKAQIVDILSDLTEFVNDSIEGFNRASHAATDTEHEFFLKSQVSQRKAFAEELNTMILLNGGKPETGTTLKGKLHRQWLDLKATFTGNDEVAVLDSCIYGEEWAQKAYNDAISNEELPADIRQKLETQRQISHYTYNTLQQMRTEAKIKQ